jgi:hypothetical protein
MLAIESLQLAEPNIFESSGLGQETPIIFQAEGSRLDG